MLLYRHSSTHRGLPAIDLRKRHARWILVATLLVGVAVSHGIRTVTAATATLSIVIPKPYITALTPSTILADGTAVITVSGGGFSSADYTIQQVEIGRSPAASFSVDSPDMLTVVTPRLAPGTCDIVATTSTGLVSQPGAPGDNTLTVLAASSPTPAPSPSATPLASASLSPSLSPAATVSPQPSPVQRTPSPVPTHHRAPSGGIGAIVHTVTTFVTHFVQHHVIIVSSLLIVVLLLLLVLILAKRRKRKPDLESRLKL